MRRLKIVRGFFGTLEVVDEQTGQPIAGVTKITIEAKPHDVARVLIELNEFTADVESLHATLRRKSEGAP